MSIEAAVIDRQAYVPKGERKWSGVDYRLSELQSRVVDQVTTLFMIVHQEEIGTWLNNAGRLLGYDFTVPNLPYDVREVRNGIEKELQTRVSQHVSQEVARVFPSPLTGQPPRGVSVKELEAELSQAIQDQATAAERIDRADVDLQEVIPLQSLIPQSVGELASLTEELRRSWALGKPPSSYSYTLEKYESLKADISARAEVARTTIATWERDEQIISSRHQQLESAGYRDAWEIESDLASARSAKDSGSWEAVREKVERVYEKIRWAERKLYERRIEELLEGLTPRIGESFAEGLRSIDAERYRYVIADDSGRRGWGRRESGLSVWLSNHRDEEAIREEFERKYLPQGYIAGHPQAQILDQLPDYLRAVFDNFESGSVLIWLPVEVEGVRVAAGCSLETVYKDGTSRRTRMPDTGVWMAEASEVMTQLRAEFEKTVDSADPEYYQKLEPVIAGFVEKARAIALSSAQEVKETFLKYHPLQRDYYQGINTQLVDLRRRRAEAERKLREIRGKTRRIPGWKARQMTDPVEREAADLEWQIRSLEDSLASSGEEVTAGPPAEEFELGVPDDAAGIESALRVGPTEEQLRALVETRGPRVEMVGKGKAAKPKVATEKQLRDRVGLWTTLVKQDTRALIGQLELLIKAKDDPAQAAIIRTILTSRGVKAADQAKVSDEQIGDAEKTLRKLINQAAQGGAATDTIHQLEEAQKSIARVKGIRELMATALEHKIMKRYLGKDEKSLQTFRIQLQVRLEAADELPTAEGIDGVIEELLSQLTS